MEKLFITAAKRDWPKQLLARYTYLLFKHKDACTAFQLRRAKLLVERYPTIEQAYKLSRKLSDILSSYTTKRIAFKKLALWYNEVEYSGLKVFRTVAKIY